MVNYNFNTGRELLELCTTKKISISAVMQQRELGFGELDEAKMREEMQKNLEVMRASLCKGLNEEHESVSGLSGKDAQKLAQYGEGKPLMGGTMTRACAAAMAVVEVNAAMGRIVAAPTAGAEGGCQAETGAAAAMAAASLVELSKGTPAQSLTAAAIALKNIMGLVCDPVAGLVECPCVKRNAIGAANALLAADMALAGIPSLIPFDEVVSAMRAVGRAMSAELRETALGGLAATPTGRHIRDELGFFRSTDA